MSKPLRTAPGSSQTQVGVLRYATEEVQRLVLKQVNQFLLTGVLPPRLKLGVIWKVPKDDLGGERPITLLETLNWRCGLL